MNIHQMPRIFREDEKLITEAQLKLPPEWYAVLLVEQCYLNLLSFYTSGLNDDEGLYPQPRKRARWISRSSKPFWSTNKFWASLVYE